MIKADAFKHKRSYLHTYMIGSTLLDTTELGSWLWRFPGEKQLGIHFEWHFECYISCWFIVKKNKSKQEKEIYLLFYFKTKSVEKLNYNLKLALYMW